MNQQTQPYNAGFEPEDTTAIEVEASAVQTPGSPPITADAVPVIAKPGMKVPKHEPPKVENKSFKDEAKALGTKAASALKASVRFLYGAAFPLIVTAALISTSFFGAMSYYKAMQAQKDVAAERAIVARQQQVIESQRQAMAAEKSKPWYKRLNHWW